jgi:hypothetical protein
MSLNKKSLIQIALLVLLVAIAAGAYLYQQEGGLDFIAGLLEDKKPEDSKTTVVRKAPEQAPADKPGAAPERRVRVGEPAAIPAHPAKGQIRGQAFALESAAIESDVLTLRPGKDTPDLEVRLKLGTPRWETPAGKSFKLTGAAGAGAPVVRVDWKEDGQARHREFGDNTTLTLEFGQEKDRKLPGKIQLTLPDEGKSRLAGTFEAEIRGFRIVNGKPDLTADATDTLEFLALREVLKDDPDKPVEVIAFRDGRIAETGVKEKPLAGFLEMEYRVGPGAPELRRYQFVKDPEWKMLRALKANQIDEAHPLAAPGPKEPPTRLFPYLAAKRLETNVSKKSPKKGIYGATFVIRHSDKHKIGVAEATYKLEASGKPQKTAYLFRLKPNGWVLERELGAKEKVNVDSGKIEKR